MKGPLRFTSCSESVYFWDNLELFQKKIVSKHQIDSKRYFVQNFRALASVDKIWGAITLYMNKSE
jgi:hypothetical protein